MEKKEQEKLQALVTEDKTLKKIYDRHRKLEREIENFGPYVQYSGSAALRYVSLKKEKLKNKELLLEALRIAN